MFTQNDYKKTNIRMCKITKDYLKFMNKIDYKVSKKKERTFIGLIVKFNNIQYVVPLTSQTLEKRHLNGKRKRSPIITTFLKENGNELADILHNNMFPVPENEIIDIKGIRDESNSYLSKEYRYIKKKWDKINEKSMNIYLSRYDKHHPNYYFLKSMCCDFKKLEEECLGWSYDHLKIKLKDEFNEEIIYISKSTNFETLVSINNYSIFSRVENFDENSHELQNIRIYAKDEFGQEKFIEIVIKIKVETPHEPISI